jgi:hypothetical protein
MTWKQKELKHWRPELKDVQTIIAWLECIPADYPDPLNAQANDYTPPTNLTEFQPGQSFGSFSFSCWHPDP